MIAIAWRPRMSRRILVSREAVKSEHDTVEYFNGLRWHMSMYRSAIVQIDLGETQELASIFFWQLAMFCRHMSYRRCSKVVVTGLRNAYLTDHHRDSLRWCLTNNWIICYFGGEF